MTYLQQIIRQTSRCLRDPLTPAQQIALQTERQRLITKNVQFKTAVWQ